MSSAEGKAEETSQEEQRPSYVASQKPQAPRHAGGSSGRRMKRAALGVGLILAAAAVLGVLAQSGAGKADDSVPTFAVARGDLTVAVRQMGVLWCMQPFEIKNEVEGSTTILYVIDEGTLLTQEDVDDRTVLVQLDSSGLEEKVANDSISFANAQADLEQAKQSYEIQEKQNESDVAIAELNVKFARMELDRYLSAELAAELLEGKVDFMNLGDNPNLGGAAQQSLRDLTDRVQLAEQRMTRATDTLNWTQKLFDKGYASQDELTGDKLAYSQAKIAHDSAQEALKLFRRYTLPKEAEKRFSDHREKLRALDRAQAKAASALTQAEAELKSGEARYRLQKNQLDKTMDMLDKCTIRATRPGRVTYGNSADPWQRQGNPIDAGVSVQQKQTLLQIADPSFLSVRMNVPEQEVDKLKAGQPALITFEAISGKTFLGRVEKISPMASAAQAMLNPDKKVYETEVALDKAPEGFIPGMSATVQVIVAQVKDALYVPSQAVTTYKGFSFAWVRTPNGPQLRQLVVGASSDKFAEIKAGLYQDERVYLAQPEERARGQIEEKVTALEAARGAREKAKPAGSETFAGPLFEGPQSPDTSQLGEAQAPGAQQGDTAQQAGRQRRSQNMTPEERARMRQQFGGGGGRGGADQGGGGRAGGGGQGGGGPAGGGGGPQGALGQ